MLGQCGVFSGDAQLDVFIDILQCGTEPGIFDG
jgi:hypothetical protein